MIAFSFNAVRPSIVLFCVVIPFMSDFAVLFLVVLCFFNCFFLSLFEFVHHGTPGYFGYDSVEKDSGYVSWIRYGCDSGYGFHGPVEAELERVQEEEKVEDWEVGECVEAGEDGGVAGGGVVGRGEGGGRAGDSEPPVQQGEAPCSKSAYASPPTL